MPTWAWLVGYFLFGAALAGLCLGWKGKGASDINVFKLLALVALWPLFIVTFGIVAAFKVSKKA